MTYHVTRMAPYEPEPEPEPPQVIRRNEEYYYTRSILRLKFDEGPFRTVGISAQPLYLKMEKGWRKFPDTSARLRLKKDDGSWVDVIQRP